MTKTYKSVLMCLLVLIFLSCTSHNPAYCEKDQDCIDSHFPSCDISIHGCVGASVNQTDNGREIDSGIDGSDGADQGKDSDAGIDGSDGADQGKDSGGDMDSDADGGTNDDSSNGDRSDGDDKIDGSDGTDEHSSDEHEQQYIFVDKDSCPETGSGTEEDPFCSIQDALDRALGGSLSVLILPGNYQEDIRVNGDVDIQGSGEGVVLETDSCPGVLVMNRAKVTISNLEITGEGGVRVTAQSDVTISDCVIHDTSCIGVDCQDSKCQVLRNQIFANGAGGINLSNSSFTVTNNMVVRNSESGAFGGMQIRQVGNGSRCAFNTVADNHTSGMAISGITCYTPALIESSIVWGNDDVGMGQMSEICTANYCDIDQDIAFVNGSKNISEDPQFIEHENDDYHIGQDSPCVDAADVNNPPDDDIDRQARPRGLGPDIGADEAL